MFARGRTFKQIAGELGVRYGSLVILKVKHADMANQHWQGHGGYCGRGAANAGTDAVLTNPTATICKPGGQCVG